MVICDCRHLKALLHKNWIYYKRQYLISAFELIFPALLMLIMLGTRTVIETTTFESQSFEDTFVLYPSLEVSDSIYIDYPLLYDPYVNLKNMITEERNTFDFLGRAAIGRFQLDPTSCIYNTQPRVIIGLSPKNRLTEEILVQLMIWEYQFRGESGYFLTFYGLYFESVESMYEYVQHPRYGLDEERPGLCAGVSFTEDVEGEMHFKMHFTDQSRDQYSNVPSQKNRAADRYQVYIGRQEYTDYNRQFFSYFQNWMANVILRTATGKPNAFIANMNVPMRSERITLDNFDYVIENLFPLCVVLMYIVPIHRVVMRVVNERENRSREIMKIMGLRESAYWFSWFIYYIAISTIISITNTAIVCYNVLPHSNWILIFAYFWLYGFSLFGYAIFIQAFFAKAKVASLVANLVYFFSQFADYAVADQYLGNVNKILGSILPSIAMKRGTYNISKFDKAMIGLQFENVTEIYYNYSVLNCYFMFIVAFIISLTLGIYFSNVLSVAANDIFRLPWYYPVSPKYWCGKTYSKSKRVKKAFKNDTVQVVPSIENEVPSPSKMLHQDQVPDGDLERSNESMTKIMVEHQVASNNYSSDTQQDDDFELRSMKNSLNYELLGYRIDLKKQESDNKILRITDLRKTFSNGFEAVKGLNIKMYTGQIFALLGHNGAGKTTTISMLTGLLNPTSGTAEVFGMDMFEDMQKVRQFLGVCPQHDILFDLLTPEEHLEIFCDFKGVDKKTQKEEIKKVLQDVDLWAFRNTIAKNLSGGSRRKLSVAIALIGGSKLVLLDEPTAGMDLSARRKLWNMLKNYKNNRIIILTTHYMDEADILGDRIGIMSGGQLICLGSSLFLKNRFGVGYNLTLVKKSKENNTKVEEYLNMHLGDVKKLSEVSSEMTFQIPLALSTKFQDFFTYFDHNLDKLDIRSYGISVTTLEEVFLRVGHGDDATVEDTIKSKENLMHMEVSEQEDFSIVDQHEKGFFNVFFIHMWAMFKKRFFIYKRNYRGLLVEIFIPVILVLIGFSFSKIQFFFDSPERTLDPSLLPLKQRILVNTDLVRKSNNDISPRSLIEGLPSYSSAFEPTYKNYSYVNIRDRGEKALLQEFDNDVFSNRLIGEMEPYRYGSYFIYEANNSTKQFKVATFLNITSQDVTALYPQFMYESILQQATGNPNLKFKVTTAPFPVTEKLRQRQATANAIFIVFVVSIGFALIPASIVSFILHEREKNLKHMQVISGMSLLAYWLSNMIFDMIKALIPSGIVIGLMEAFDINYPNVWRLFLLYPVGVIPFTYVSSFLFQSENVAQTVTIFVHFVFAGIGAIATYIMRIIDSTMLIGDKLNWILKVCPSFCLTNSIMFSSSRTSLFAVRPELQLDDLDKELMGGDILLLCMHFVFWIIVLVMIELGAFSFIGSCLSLLKKNRIPPKAELDLDNDVLEEKTRIAQSDPKTMQVRVNQFRKMYPSLFREPVVAVERTSFGLEQGECFALLGVNGAGKTTTFKSLTYEITPSSGSVEINGMDVRKEFNKVRKLIGYCPQHDAIFELMTVEEHLDYYARIKGIPKGLRNGMIEKQIKEMNLQEHRLKPAGTLSGGNKRKLSVALAILGNPPIILLDEPSAGMDPEARRFMWSIVSRISQQRKKSAVILTTHSMEEAEALSTKMGIMVKGGVFRCFGSSQHIKNKFGTGYEIEIKIKKITNEDLGIMAELYGHADQEYIRFDDLAELMRHKLVDEFLIDELREKGLGQDLLQEAGEQNGQISYKNFIMWLYIEQSALRIIESLCEDFESVEILEHYNDYYKIRVPRGEKSIGFVFGLIETKKAEYNINEYSVSQTTLEQIFQNFANLKVDDNAAHKFVKKNGTMKQALISDEQEIKRDTPKAINTTSMLRRQKMD